jgi:hypothetical protein
MVALSISSILYTNLDAFYPIYLEQKHPELSAIHFGLVVAFFGVSNLLTSLGLGMYISKI